MKISNSNIFEHHNNSKPSRTSATSNIEKKPLQTNQRLQQFINHTPPPLNQIEETMFLTGGGPVSGGGGDHYPVGILNTKIQKRHEILLTPMRINEH